MSKLILRSADIQDMQLLFDWANDPTVRKNSFHKEHISWAEHVAWLEAVLENPLLEIFIFTVDGVPAGQVRLKQEERGCLLSYSIASAYRGQGYGKAMLALLENTCLEQGRDIKLFAEVKKQNVASQKVFRCLGYKEKECAGCFIYEKDTLSAHDASAFVH